MLEKWGNVRKLGYDITMQDPHKQRLLRVLLFCLVKNKRERKTRLTQLLWNVMFDALAQMLLQSESRIYTLKNT
jgi:DNA-binding SARP family transcriptional activator